MKKNKYIFFTIGVIILLLFLSNPDWNMKKSNIQDPKNNIETENLKEETQTKNLVEDKIGYYQGFVIEFIDMELKNNLTDKGISQNDCHVSQVLDEEGNVIPDKSTGTDSLLLVRFRVCNENGRGEQGEKYLLLNGAIQCEELLEKNIVSLPFVLLIPHGPDDTEGKELNRLYFEKDSLEENEERLFLEKGEETVFTMGLLIKKDWLRKDSDIRLILFQDSINGELVFKVSEEDLI